MVAVSPRSLRVSWPRVSDLANAPTLCFLRGLATVRDNPFVLLMLRRDARSKALPLWIGLWLVALSAVAVAGLEVATRFRAPLSRAPLPGFAANFPAMLLTTVEFLTIVRAAASRRYGLRAAEMQQCAEHYRLLPLPPAQAAGMRNTYPLATALVMMTLALPLHVVCALAGGEGLFLLPLTHLFILVCSLGVFESPSPERPQPTRGEMTPERMKALQRRRSIVGWVVFAQVFSNLVGRGMTTALGGKLLLWIVFLPFMLPRALLTPIPFFNWHLPVAVPLAAALVPHLTLLARRSGRALSGRAETLRVPPWSLAGLGTVFGLFVLLGYVWRFIVRGDAAWALGATGPDPRLAADGAFVLLLVAWGTLLAGFGFLRGGPITWGPLASPHEVTEPLRGRSATVRELAWLAEAALSVYVPVLAFTLAWLVARDVPVPLTPAAHWALATAMSALAASWALGRLAMRLHQSGKQKLLGFGWLGLILGANAAMFLPPPFGRCILGLFPPSALLGAIPGLGGRIERATAGVLPADLPEPALAVPMLISIAALITVANIRGWAAHPGLARPEPARPARPAVELYARRNFAERVTSNPVAIRLLRGRRVSLQPAAAGTAFALASLSAYAVWVWAILAAMRGAPRGSVAGYLAESPALLGGLVFGTSLLVAVIQAGSAPRQSLRAERAVGALAMTCLTPLSTRQIHSGYVIQPLAAAGLGVAAGALAAPLLFVGVPVRPMAGWLLFAVLWAAFLVWVMVMSGILDGLPRPPWQPVSSLLRRVLSQVAVAATVILGFTLPIVFIGFCADRGPAAVVAHPVFWVGLAALLAGGVYTHVESVLRMELMRSTAIPDKPEPELLEQVAPLRRR